MDTNNEIFLLSVLIEEEGNVVTAETEARRCEESVREHKQRLDKLRNALNVLRVETKSSIR